MAILKPQKTLRPNEVALLRLLASLLVESLDQPLSGNLTEFEIPISDSEAGELLALLEDYILSRRFVENSYFVDNLVGVAGPPDEELKKLYSRKYRGAGKGRIFTRSDWNEFLLRLGIGYSKDARIFKNPRRQVRPMEIEYFARMEKLLIQSVELDSRVSKLLEQFVDARLGALQRMREDGANQYSGSIKKGPDDLLKNLRPSTSSLSDQKPLSRQNVSSIMLIVIDCSALFTTRDWSVAGVLSGIAASMPNTH